MKAFLIWSLFISMGLFAGAVSAEQELDGSAVEKLALRGIWAAEENSYGY